MVLLFLRLSLFLPAILATACVRWTPATMAPVPSGGCRSAPVKWLTPDDRQERRRLDLWCEGVGGAIFIPAPAVVSSPPPGIEQITFVSWNVHVGNGDVRAFVADLRAGVHSDGRPIDHFVLMIQEAVRTSGVPAFTRDMAGAERIPAAAAGRSIDITAIARDLGLALVYVASMRNGRSANDPAEDRGSAILSTLPLSDPLAIELPGEGQRRVAILARTDSVSVGTIHLDALGSWNLRLRLLWSPWLRDAQIRSLLPFLPDGPLIVGADLNTWHGRNELAVRVLDRLGRETPVTIDRNGLGLRVLDYLFFRVGQHRRARYQYLQNRYGSDHRPLVGWVE